MNSYAFAWRAFAALCLSVSLGYTQGDPLVSKNLPFVFADKAGFWVFASDGLRFSRIDPAKDPLDIRDGMLTLRGGIRGGLGRSSTALLFFGYPTSDSTTVGGLLTLSRDGKPAADTVVFARPSKGSTSITSGVEISALARWQDTLIIGAGRGGIALTVAAAEGRGVLARDTLNFRALPAGEDSAVAALRCIRNATCPVAGLAEISEKIGEPDSVTALAVDTASDSAWLLIGSRTGLRRGPLGGNAFPAVVLPSAKPGPIRIESIFADPAHALLWVFSGSEYFFSGDHGRTFHKPTRISGLSVAPDSLTGFSAKPAAAFSGDTTFINFNLADPGLVLFRRDTLLANQGAGDLADVVFDKADGLDIERGQGRLTTLAAIPGASGTTLLAGSTFKGVFLRRTGGAWINANSLKALKNGLEEVITFPTLFTGSTVDGQPDYVRLGYRLKKNGKVTITVYNYAMEKVKTLVRNSQRKGGGNRSEDPEADRWDGKDASGRYVSVGTYYILVESDQGEKGWGKAIAVHGRGK